MRTRGRLYYRKADAIRCGIKIAEQAIDGGYLHIAARCIAIRIADHLLKGVR